MEEIIFALFIFIASKIYANLTKSDEKDKQSLENKIEESLGKFTTESLKTITNPPIQKQQAKNSPQKLFSEKNKVSQTNKKQRNQASNQKTHRNAQVQQKNLAERLSTYKEQKAQLEQAKQTVTSTKVVDNSIEEENTLLENSIDDRILIRKKSNKPTLKQKQLIQAVVMKEVLDKPVSLR